jgi:hypothetical protein
MFSMILIEFNWLYHLAHMVTQSYLTIIVTMIPYCMYVWIDGVVINPRVNKGQLTDGQAAVEHKSKDMSASQIWPLLNLPMRAGNTHPSLPFHISIPTANLFICTYVCMCPIDRTQLA